MKLSEELEWRGLSHQTTFKNFDDINQPRTFYLGVDPSAKSMHIGNLAQVIVVKHLARHGHSPIVLVGGATGMIGDPKMDAERKLKTIEEIEKNKAGIAAQYKQLLEGDEFKLVDNYDWFKGIGYLDFLRDIGKNFSMTQLLDREFIKARIGDGGIGISYAEFSYSLIQGYDFLHLYREYGASLQIGGSDQWGNMLSGSQIIKKLEGVEAHVWTVPLIVDKSTGKKFGKSEGNAVWLDADMTSPYKFYQFWLNLDDTGVGDYIKTFTMITPAEYDQLMESFNSDTKSRVAQKYLAYEVTKLVHGQDKADSARSVTEALFGDSSIESLLSSDLELLSGEIPVVSPSGIIDVLVNSGMTKSKGEARRLIAGGAVSVNGKKVTDIINIESTSLVKKGRNSFALVK